MTHTTGPVPLDSQHYVARKFEQETLEHIFRKEWVLLLGPRQHGKTSALIRIRDTIRGAGLRCAFVDLQALPPALSFSRLLEWFARRIAASLGSVIVQRPQEPCDSLEDWLTCAVAMPGAPVVVLIDEASAISDDAVRNAFFGQIRALKSAAVAANPGALCTIVQFVFAGTFRPESLVDERNSPFNVCRRVDTDDLSGADVLTLAKLAFGRDEVDEISELIFENVGGQPHLVQTLLATASAHPRDGEARAVLAEIERIAQHGNDHIDSIFGAVISDQNLVRIASASATNGHILNDPANVDYRFATVIGLMRREERNLVFRNRLYKRMAESSTQLRPEVLQVNGNASPFYPLAISIFAFVSDLEYREICHAAHNGAISAVNSGSYRLALVAFGVALEAMLIDFLVQKNAILAATIAGLHGGGRPNFRAPHEDSTNPTTWSLANQMKVARAIAARNGPAEIPEALRQMRNYVHPTVMKNAYRPESELYPEALAAGGLVAIVMRDLQ